MEKLHKMLKEYNITHQEEQQFASWEKQFTQQKFPKYWMLVYEILSHLDNKLRVIEVGCGLGDITAILCYLGYTQLIAFERDNKIYNIAQRKIYELFSKNVLCNKSFPLEQVIQSDLLIVVNCVYKDCVNSKQEYIELMKKYYRFAGSPKYFILEVIDASYTIKNDEFPEYMRLTKKDIEKMFPYANIKGWQTYIYPQNSKSKTLYLITNEDTYSYN